MEAAPFFLKVMTMTEHSIPQDWQAVKMTSARLGKRLDKNPSAEMRWEGDNQAVYVDSKRVAIFVTVSELLHFAPKPSTPSQEKLASFAPNGGPRRADDGRPLCPKCGDASMVVKWNRRQEAYWRCASCRATKRFYPLPEDLERAGHYWQVALAYTLERFCAGRDFSHLWANKITPTMIELMRKKRAQKVTDRTVKALRLIQDKRPTADDFRRLFWPDSVGSAAYLPTLVARGLVCLVVEHYRLTFAGGHTLQREKLVEAGLCAR